MRYRISHRTTYAYETPVSRSFHVLHLKPGPIQHQALVSHALLIDPVPARNETVIDAFDNPTSVLCIDEEHRELTVHARSIIDVDPPPPPAIDASSAWESVAERARRGNELAVDVMQFLCASRHTPLSEEVRAFADASFPKGRPALAGVMHLTQRIFNDFKYDPAATDVSTPVGRVLSLRRGVCQDFAHLAIAALKTKRIPARYVSGYLLTRPPPGQPKLRGVDASHAWLSAWCPEAGWVDFDPTNGLIPRGEHIAVAVGRDYDDICPVSGVLLGGSGQKMAVSVDVEQIEAPEPRRSAGR